MPVLACGVRVFVCSVRVWSFTVRVCACDVGVLVCVHEGVVYVYGFVPCVYGVRMVCMVWMIAGVQTKLVGGLGSRRTETKFHKIFVFEITFIYDVFLGSPSRFSL